MRQSLFGMLCSSGGMFLLALTDGRLEMRNAFLGVRIGFRLLGRLGMFKRGFSVGDEHVRASLLPAGDGFFRVLKWPRPSDPRLRRDAVRTERRRQTKSDSENSAVHDYVPPSLSLMIRK